MDELRMVFVPGTAAYPFGGDIQNLIRIPDFYIAAYQVTQRLWDSVMGNHPAQHCDDDLPVVAVSWYDVQEFMARLSARQGDRAVFRLPTESEWEYAAMGGPNWPDGFTFAGTHEMNEAGWYEGNAGPFTDLSYIRQLRNHEKKTELHPAGLKKPNQLGLYDMNGNVWEWCQDWFQRDNSLVPKDGSAYAVPTQDKVLRGGCHHNGAIHCTNFKRYEIPPDSRDDYIGFRLACTI